MDRRATAFTLQQASDASPVLSRLAALTRESVARLKAIEPLLPAALRSSVTAGPIDAKQWCLLLDNTATAAKLRQLLPALEAHLRVKGWDSRSIRLKVQESRSR